jgi:hypothetical protein
VAIPISACLVPWSVSLLNFKPFPAVAPAAELKQPKKLEHPAAGLQGVTLVQKEVPLAPQVLQAPQLMTSSSQTTMSRAMFETALEPC